MTDASSFTPPAGWTESHHRNTFSTLAGPFYFREGDDPGVGFFAEPHHANLNGIVHGGALLTLADMSLWDIVRRHVGAFTGVTVTMNSEFVGPGKVGTFITATGDLVKAGNTLAFARGVISGEGETLLSFSGTLKVRKL